MFVFSTYLTVFLLKFWSREIPGCEIKFSIQRVPTRHTFNGPLYPKNKKYLKKHDDDFIITFFQVFLVFGVAGSIKSNAEWVLVGCGIYPSSSPDWNLIKDTTRYVENTNKKVVFFFASKINKYYFIIFLRPILSWNFP